MVLAFIGTQSALLCFEVSTYDMIFLAFIEPRKATSRQSRKNTTTPPWPSLVTPGSVRLERGNTSGVLVVYRETSRLGTSEEEFKKTRKLPDSSSTDNAEYQIVFSIIKEWLQSDQKKYHKMKDRLVGVFEETTTRVKRLYQMQANAVPVVAKQQQPSRNSNWELF
ncbi:hypothetical protein L1987_64868 [Smallanthus sonchifolius]|uniref:Uncharacterized protein n=1 Tax=Smallanthus sonchifolius TaxID=185202 RepID=A0ACB9BT32_9ASTR|nr:hypothetical protein L1987_64868 [Smallanthus sonchifolius]